MGYGHLELQIEELLKERGISKNTICKELDIPRSNFNRYCRNEFQRVDAQLICKLQLKYNSREIAPSMLRTGFLRLKKKYDGHYNVKVLFIENELIQVIIGTEKAISEIKEEFEMRIC